MPNAPSSLIDQFTMSLRGISPMIWRRLLVPADLTLYGLHRTIQIAFVWNIIISMPSDSMAAATPSPGLDKITAMLKAGDCLGRP
jgi:hypothetical protein